MSKSSSSSSDSLGVMAFSPPLSSSQVQNFAPPLELDCSNDGNHSSEEELEEIYKGEPIGTASTSSATAGPPIPTAVASAEVTGFLFDLVSMLPVTYVT